MAFGCGYSGRTCNRRRAGRLRRWGGSDAAATANGNAVFAPQINPVQVKVPEVAAGLVNAWSLAFLPDGRMLVTQRAGSLLPLAADGKTSNTVAGVPAVENVGQGGLLDVVLDPAFASSQRIYLCYAERDAANATPSGTTVARAELNTSTRTLSNVTVIFRQSPKVQSTGHFGSRLVFDTRVTCG